MSGHPRVRTFNARRGRVSALAHERLETLGPARALPPGPLDLARTFGRRAPFVLEVGCGYGYAAIAYALTHPEHDLLAVDVHPPGLAHLLAAAEELAVGNLAVEIGDAVELIEDRVGSAQLDAVHLFFPDPWPKLRHAKRRFVSGPTLDLLADRLAPEGQLLVATDQADYAAYAISQVEAHGAFVARVVDRPAWRPTDGFEAKALAEGRPSIELRIARH